VDALARGIKSLRMTCCYEDYHENPVALRDEANHRHNNAIKEGQESTVSAQDRFRMQRRTALLERFAHASMLSEEMENDRLAGSRNYAQNLFPESSSEMKVGWLRTIVLPDLESRWEKLKEENKTIFGKVWTSSIVSPRLYGAHYDAVAGYVLAKEGLITTIAKSLAPFKQLHTFAFVEPEIDAWSRYETLFKEVGEEHGRLQGCRSPYARGSKRDASSEAIAYSGTMIGLDVALRALQRAEIHPTSFAMPVPSIGFQSFKTSVSRYVLSEVLTQTNKLCLNHLSLRFLRVGSSIDDRPTLTNVWSRETPPPVHTEILLTNDSFPSLRDLTLYFNQVRSENEPGPSIHGCKAAELESLTIRYDPRFEASANGILWHEDCLNHFHQSLKHLTIVNAFCGNWNNFFRDIAKAQLETLDIVIEDDVLGMVRTKVPSNDDVENGLVCVQERFKKAAEKVEVRPDWVFHLVKRVWKNQDDIVDRLLDDSDEEGRLIGKRTMMMTRKLRNENKAYVFEVRIIDTRDGLESNHCTHSNRTKVANWSCIVHLSQKTMIANSSLMRVIAVLIIPEFDLALTRQQCYPRY